MGLPKTLGNSNEAAVMSQHTAPKTVPILLSKPPGFLESASCWWQFRGGGRLNFKARPTPPPDSSLGGVTWPKVPGYLAKAPRCRRHWKPRKYQAWTLLGPRPGNTRPYPQGVLCACQGTPRHTETPRGSMDLLPTHQEDCWTRPHPPQCRSD